MQRACGRGEQSEHRGSTREARAGGTEGERKELNPAGWAGRGWTPQNFPGPVQEDWGDSKGFKAGLKWGSMFTWDPKIYILEKKWL